MAITERFILLKMKKNDQDIRFLRTLRYEKELVRLIKSLPLYAWDQENRWWTIAHTENSLAALVSFCEESGWEYQYLEDLRHLNKKPRQRPEDVINYRAVPATYLDKLYSEFAWPFQSEDNSNIHSHYYPGNRSDQKPLG
ncbi:MAG: hypothetical protein U9N54_09620 [candidate division Zixibacteria bacterium]|nr:hypothetical protein [candidate division Zixibacteria bacterium]